MKLKFLAAVCSAGLILAPVSALAATLTNVSIGLSNNTASRPTNLVITYTIPTTLSGGPVVGDSDVLLDVIFDGGVVLTPQGTCSVFSVTDDGVTVAGAAFGLCQNNATEITIRMGNGQTIQAGSVIQITVAASVATTGPTPGPYSTSSFRTIYNFGTGVDTPAAQPSFTVAPAPVPTMSEWAMILLGLILAGGAALYIQRRRLAV